MKMWKLLCYDIKYGCIKNLKLLLFPVIFEMAVLFMLWQKMNSYAQYGISTQKHMGDVLLYNFGGMEKYKMSMENVFQFPVTWMLLFVMILFVTLSYPMNNLCGFGNKLLIKGKSRVKWWLSKMYMESALQYYFLWDNFYINSVFLQYKRHTVRNAGKYRYADCSF